MSVRTNWLASAAGVALIGGYAFIGAVPAGAAQVACTPSAGFNTCVQFTYSGAQQTFTVPDGVTSLSATLLGASGNGVSAGGGQASGTVAVTPGETLTVTVGQSTTASTVRTFGGGGPGAGVPAGCTRLCGSSGGGMSALWAGAPNVAADALIVAGGGGGSGGGPSSGGPGGGLTGGAAVGGAAGGTQTAGGLGSLSSCGRGGAGSQFLGGQGAGGAQGGGGGGGGWFGGGGGYCATGTTPAGGGGGGSSYISGPGVTDGATTAGVNTRNSNGVVTLQFNVPIVDTPAVDFGLPAEFGGALLIAAAVALFVRRRLRVT